MHQTPTFHSSTNITQNDVLAVSQANASHSGSIQASLANLTWALSQLRKTFPGQWKVYEKIACLIEQSRILPGIRLRSSLARPAICTCSTVYRLLNTCADLTGSSRESPKRLDTCDSTLVTLLGYRMSVHK